MEDIEDMFKNDDQNLDDQKRIIKKKVMRKNQPTNNQQTAPNEESKHEQEDGFVINPAQFNKPNNHDSTDPT